MAEDASPTASPKHVIDQIDETQPTLSATLKKRNVPAGYTTPAESSTPRPPLVAYSSLDKTYSLHELSNFSQVYHSAPADEPITSLAIHPDGALLALGTPSSKIQISDVRSGAVAATISPQGTPFSVHTLSFSENGYHLLAPDSLSSVAIWNLRKMTTAHSIPLGDAF
ncbi:hypothetical protein PAXINDRAFT_19979 [Paxillus involutus ATCC 200175]|uniref:Pre-mRNA-processing factor 19 n=1 Tax=Paxillus involutus ATCC 200175 TaxID=664439 RepID=A0A0C9SMV3_PAXIN|nr:hypothetical protein PAXINDRAFT_19979 [Paxillus involutus ATCC 200175]